MKNFIYKAFMGIAMLTWLCACSSDDDENGEEPGVQNQYTLLNMGTAPSWEIDWTHHDERPNWESPDAAGYENWMIVMVKLQDELVPFASQDDLMAAYIGHELRAVNGPAKTSLEGTETTGNGAVRFILKILGNESSDKKVKITLKYYNSKLKQIFTLEGDETFTAEKVWGVDQDLVLPLTKGSSKYPVHMDLMLGLQALEKNFTFTGNDLVAVMVGDECRGIMSMADAISNHSTAMTVYGKQEGEEGRLLYYNAESRETWDLNTTVTISSGGGMIYL